MKGLTLFGLFLFILIMGGCAVLDKMAPAKYDSDGKIIPGSRQPTAIVKTVADNIPYGNFALALVLTLAAGYEKFRSYKLEKGLKATLLAGKKVANDPEMKEAWDKVKDEYRQAHENAGVTTLIKSMIAKLPSVTKSI